MSTSSQSNVSSTGVSLLSAKRSTTNTEGQTSMTENWNKTCNCRHVKFRTISIPETQSSNMVTTTCMPKLKDKFRTRQKSEISDKKSSTAEGVLNDGKIVCYCCGQCALHNAGRIAPCNCETCLSTYYKWKSNVEDTACDTAESQSTSSEREEFQKDGASRTESQVTSDDYVSSRASVTASSSVSRTTVSDAEVDDRSQCESTVEHVRNERGITGQTVLCPNCYRNNYYAQTTSEGVANDSESTDGSEVSEENDDQDEEQKSATDGEHGDASTADSYSDTADRCGKTARTESQISTSLKSDVTSRCESQVSAKTRNAKCCHWQRVDKAAAVSKWCDHDENKDDDDDEDAGVTTAEDGDTQRTESCTTTVTSTIYSRSSRISNKELDASDSEHVDDNEHTEMQSISEECTDPCKHFEVTTRPSDFVRSHLAIDICLSVRQSVRPSVCQTPAPWQNEIIVCRYVDTVR